MKTITTKDNKKVKNNESIWYINGDTCHNALLRIGYHDERYIIYKHKKNVIKELN